MTLSTQDLQNLEITIGDEEVLVVTSDVPVLDLSASIVGVNLHTKTQLDTNLISPLNMTVTLSSEATEIAKQRGTILQIVMNLGGGRVKNIRVNLVGKLC